MSDSLNYVEHKYGMGETIRAVLKKYNHLKLTPQMLDILMKRYQELNGEGVPKPGQTAKIPILPGMIGMR